MIDATVEFTETVPLELAWEIDRLCDEYERSCTPSHQPLIENWLQKVVETGRKPLLRELLLTEIDFRSRNDLPVNAEEYEQRFPGYERIVADVFAWHSMSSFLHGQCLFTYTIANGII